MFFNGNTFADIGRRLTAAVLADLPAVRLRQVTSAAAHYIAGVLDREAMTQIIEQLCQTTLLTPGSRVKTLKGSTCGVVTRVLDDGRIIWRTDSGTNLTALPESLSADS